MAKKFNFNVKNEALNDSEETTSKKPKFNFNVKNEALAKQEAVEPDVVSEPTDEPEVDKLLSQIEQDNLQVDVPPTTEPATPSFEAPTIGENIPQESLDAAGLEIQKIAQERSAVRKKAARDKYNVYGDDILYAEVDITTDEDREVYDSMRSEVLDVKSQPYQLDTRVNSLMSISPEISHSEANKMALNEHVNYITSKIFNNTERSIFETQKQVRDLELEYKSNPTQDNLIALAKAGDELKQLQGKEWEPLYDESGRLIDQEFKDFSESDFQDIKSQTQEYKTWDLNSLKNEMLNLNAQYRALEVMGNPLRERVSSITIPTPTSYTPASYTPTTSKEYKQLSKLSELQRPLYKKLKAVSHAVLLNRDLGAVDTGKLDLLGRGIAEGTFAGQFITTESEMQESFNDAVLSAGGKITEKQFESAARSIGDKSAMAIGTSLPIMLEMAVTGNVIGAASKSLSLGAKANRLISLSRKTFGRRGEFYARALTNVAKTELKSGLTFGLTPSEDITFAMGVGEGLGQRLGDKILNRFSYKGKVVGRLGEFLTRTMTGTATETMAEFSGDMINEMSKNGYDFNKAFKDSYGATGDEQLDNMLTLALTCSLFSGTSNIGALTKVKKSISMQPESKAKESASEKIDLIIQDTQSSSSPSTVGVDVNSSELGQTIIANDGLSVEKAPLSTETDNILKNIAEDVNTDPKATEQALEEINSIEDVMLNTPLDNLNITESQRVSILEATTEAKQAVETRLQQSEKLVTETQKTKTDAKEAELQQNTETTTETDAKTETTREVSDSTQETEVVEEVDPNQEVIDQINTDRQSELDAIPSKDSANERLRKASEINKKYDALLEELNAEKVVESEVTPQEITLDTDQTTEVVEESTVSEEVEPEFEIMKELDTTQAMNAETDTFTLTGPEINPSKLKQFEKLVKQTSKTLDGLDIKTPKVKKLINKTAEIARQIDNIKAKDPDISTEKFNALTEKYNQEIADVITETQNQMAQVSKKKAVKTLKDLSKRSLKKGEKKAVGTREIGAKETYDTMTYILEGNDIDPAQASQTLQDYYLSDIEESGKPVAAEVTEAEAVLVANEMLNGHENWGLKEWSQFNQDIKDIDKIARQKINDVKKRVKVRNQSIRTKVNADVDTDVVPTSDAELNVMEAKREGYVSDEQAKTNFGKKVYSSFNKLGSTMDDFKKNFFKGASKTYLHLESVLSVLSKSGSDGNLVNAIVRPLDRGNSNQRAFYQQKTNDYMRESLKFLNPDKYNEIAKNVKGSQAAKEINKAFRNILDTRIRKRVSSGDLLRIDLINQTEQGGAEATFVFSPDKAMEIYAWSRNPKIKDELKAKHGIDDAKLDIIKNYIGNDMVQLVDYTTDTFNKDMYNSMNDTYNKMYYTNMPYIENYFPVKRSGFSSDALKIDDSNSISQAVSVSSSMLKQRTDTSKPLDLSSNEGFLSSIFSHVKDASDFVAYAEATRDINAALRSRNLKAAMDYYGISNIVNKQILSAMGKYRGEGIKVKSIDWLLNNYSNAVLAMKGVQVVKQSTSFLNAYPQYIQVTGKSDIFGFPAFIANAAKTGTKAMLTPKGFSGKFERLYNSSSVLRDRIDSEMINVDMDVRSNSKPWVKMTSKQKMAQITGEIFKYPTKYGDLMGIMMGYEQIYDAVLKKTGDKKLAIEAFEKYDSTQQSRNPLYHSNLQIEGGTFVSLMTRFRSSQILYLNKSIQAIDSMAKSYKTEYKNTRERSGRINSIANGLKGVKGQDLRNFLINWSISNMAYQSIASAGAALRGDEEDYIQDLIRAGVIGPLNGVVLIGSLAQGMWDISSQIAKDGKVTHIPKFDDSVDVMEMFADVTKAGNTYLKDDDISSLVLYMAQVYGLPMETMQQASLGAIGLKENFEDGDLFTEDNLEQFMRLMGYTEYQITGPKKKGKQKLPGQ